MMSASEKRRVVVIMTDTQGTNVIGCYGQPDMKTPYIDALAQSGMKCTKAHTTSPVCGPARSAIFTGTWPHTNGSWGNDMPIGLNVKTVGQRVQDSGAHTAYIGKWHLDGFDYFGNGKCPDGWNSDYWYDMRCYLEEMTPEERVLSRKALSPEQVAEHAITEDFTFGHKCSNKAIDFLEKYNDEDFLLVVSYDEPHHPYMCPEPFCSMYEGYEYPLGKNAFDDMENKPEHQKEWVEAAGIHPHKSVSNSLYFGCNSFVDYEIGRVIKAVDEFAPDALVIFTSDHGSPLNTHRLNTKGPAMYEETTHIPFIMRWPKHITPGTVNDNPVSHSDITPTILDAMNIEIPDIIEGKSMVGECENPEKPTNDAVFMEFNRYEIDHDGWGGFQPVRCVYDGELKLVINLHYTDELYDLSKDPEELYNLIDDPAYSARCDALHDAILEWMNRTRDPFRGAIWERRPWREKRSLRWGGPTRPRPDDGYEPRALLYETGLEVEGYEIEKN